MTFDGSLNYELDPTYIPHETHSGQLKRSIVKPGDVLMNIVGPPLGKVSIVPDTFPEWNINQAIVRFRCLENLYNKFLAYYLIYSETVQKLNGMTKASVGQQNITVTICRNLEIPLPALPKQLNLVNEL